MIYTRILSILLLIGSLAGLSQPLIAAAWQADSQEILADFSIKFEAGEDINALVQQSIVAYGAQKTKEIVLNFIQDRLKMHVIAMQSTDILESAEDVIAAGDHIYRIYVLCVTYLEIDPDNKPIDIMNEQGKPVNFEALAKVFFAKTKKALKDNMALYFKSQLYLPFLQRALEARPKMTEEQNHMFMQKIGTPKNSAEEAYTNDSVQELSKEDLSEQLEALQKDIDNYLRQFELQDQDTMFGMDMEA